MINIVYIVPYLIKSGPINVLYNIVKYLDRNIYNPIIITLIKNKYPHRDNKVDFEKLKIDIIEYGYSNFYLQVHLKSISFDILTKVNSENSIFHAHGYYPTMILSLMNGVKTITTIHNICEQDFILQKGKMLGMYMSYCYKKALKHIKVCVPISDYMKSFYETDASLTLRTVYNGVNQGSLHTEDEKKAIKKDIGLSTEVKVLLYPAGFSYLKNQQGIIESVLSSKRNDFVILFAGQGTIEEDCKKLAKGDSRIKFLGYQMDMEPFWAISDYMISASRSEGLPMAVLEAYVRGIPCILSNIPPHKEVMLKVMGNNDLCFDIENTQNLAYLLESQIDDVYDADAIRFAASKFYTSKVMSDNYCSIYRNLLSI